MLNQPTVFPWHLLPSPNKSNGQHLVKATPLDCYEECFKKPSQFFTGIFYAAEAKLAPLEGCAWAAGSKEALKFSSIPA